MGELIDRDALLAECAAAQKSDPYFEERGWANHFINSAGEPSTEWYAVEDMIENAPAVDAVPVVRCVDCQRFFPNKRYAFGNVCFRCPPGREREYFCADGERIG